MFTARTLKKPTVRRACRITGYTDHGPSPAPCELRLTRSPELQRRNGVMLLLHSGVTTSEPTSPSATGAPVFSSITSRKYMSAKACRPWWPSASPEMCAQSSAVAPISAQARSKDQHVVPHVLRRARIEERPPGGAAGAPVLDHPGARPDAELVVEALRRDLPQVFLGQDRYFSPDLWIIQPLQVDLRHPFPEERRAHCALDGNALSFGLNFQNMAFRGWPAEIHAHTPR